MEYRETSCLKAEGGTEIWLAEDPDGRKAVLKRYQGPCPDALLRTLTELRHPNLAAVLAWRPTADGYEILEEYLEGATLEELLEGGKPFSRREFFSLALQLGEALAALHRKGIICRDVKPGNIMLDENGHLTLFDFDAARLYTAGRENDTRHLGTVGYAPPEQYGYGQTDDRTDIFAYGVTLQRLPEIPRSCRKILKKCTRFDPEKRYGSMCDVLRLLKRRKNPVLWGLRWTGGAALAVCCLLYLLVLWSLTDFLIQTESSQDPPPSLSSALSQQTTESSASSPVQKMENPVRLGYRLNQSDEEDSGIWNVNGEGEWAFGTDTPLEEDPFGVEDFHDELWYVTYTIPRSSVCFQISSGDYELHNPVVRFQFYGVYLYGQNFQEDGLEYTGNLHGIGTFTGMEWRPVDTDVLRDTTFRINFAHSAFLPNAHATVTIQADGCKDLVFDIPIRAYDFQEES